MQTHTVMLLPIFTFERFQTEDTTRPVSAIVRVLFQQMVVQTFCIEEGVITVNQFPDGEAHLWVIGGRKGRLDSVVGANGYGSSLTIEDYSGMSVVIHLG